MILSIVLYANLFNLLHQNKNGIKNVKLIILYTVVFVLDAKSVKTSALMSTSVECMISSKLKSLIETWVMMCIIAEVLTVCRVILKI